MRALICAASLLGLLGLFAWSASPAGAQDDEKPTIKDIMAKLHKGSKGALNVVKAELKGESPNWGKVETEAKIIDKLGAYLAKTEAPKGDQAAYEKLAKAYHKNAKDLAEAAGDKNLDKAKAATKKLGASCKACHSAHKED